jgi:hypothetical protein
MLAVPAGEPAECVALTGGFTMNLGTHAGVEGEAVLNFGFAGDAGALVPGSSTIFDLGGTDVGIRLPDVDICGLVYRFGSHQYWDCVFGGGVSGALYLGWISNLGPALASSTTSIAASTELAGQPSAFHASGMSTPGQELLTVPIKVRLRNNLLGPHCYVGTDQDPIVIQLVATSGPTSTSTAADPNSFPVSFTFANGARAADVTFAEPGATGCNGLAQAVNLILGLPRAGGRNTFALGPLSASVASTQAGGQTLSQAWHEGLNR